MGDGSNASITYADAGIQGGACDPGSEAWPWAGALSFACSGHIDCCQNLHKSTYALLDVCAFGSWTDYRFAARCCTDEVFRKPQMIDIIQAARPELETAQAVISEFNRLCYTRQDGDAQSCEFVDPSICCPGGGGIALPFSENEVLIDPGTRIVIYLVLLGWLFLGVAIISDIFMAAIEEITAKQKDTYRIVDGVRRRVKVNVWNYTVANLTLMALGSSAPEIMLAVLELFQRNFYAGPLGPTTIVGSAAFNLFVITGVCCSVIPSTEVRFILNTDVYKVTLFTSIFAYLWLTIILRASSPDLVEIWEGVFTLLMFPLLILAAYIADRGACASTKVSPDGGELTGGESELEQKQKLSVIVKSCTDMYGQAAEEKTLERLIALRMKHGEVKSRAYYRVLATRHMTGSKRLHQQHQHEPNLTLEKIKAMVGDHEEDENEQVIEFAAPHYSCLESDPLVRAQVFRGGPTTAKLTVSWRTIEGTATAGEDYVHSSGTCVFDLGEDTAEIEIPLIDDDKNEPDEDFYIELFDLQSTQKHRFGVVQRTTVTIIDDDEAGIISFTMDDFESCESDKVGRLWAQRKEGSSADVSCLFKCIPGTAKPGIDYEDTTGEIIFRKGETSKAIEIPLIDDGAYEKNARFEVELYEPGGGAKFDQRTISSDGRCIACVHITANSKNRRRVDKLMEILAPKADSIKLGGDSWLEQFQAAIHVNGGEEPEEDEEPPSFQDYALHFIAMPWKVIFACTPPPSMSNGWPAFWTSLIFIGALTAMVGDCATLFGCCCSVPDEITAITFVALGTSLPDTFASKTAATIEPYADAAVGNVTGSNSVNVFLGLGIPWTIGSIYWTKSAEKSGPSEEWLSRYAYTYMTGSKTQLIIDEYANGGFLVPAGALGFSVLVYTTLAFLASFFLYFRRITAGGELGGKNNTVASAVFVSFWLLYISLNIWYNFSSSVSF